MWLDEQSIHGLGFVTGHDIETTVGQTNGAPNGVLGCPKGTVLAGEHVWTSACVMDAKGGGGWVGASQALVAATCHMP